MTASKPGEVESAAENTEHRRVRPRKPRPKLGRAKPAPGRVRTAAIGGTEPTPGDPNPKG